MADATFKRFLSGMYAHVSLDVVRLEPFAADWASEPSRRDAITDPPRRITSAPRQRPVVSGDAAAVCFLYTLQRPITFCTL